MQVIHKYCLDVKDNKVSMPFEAKILKIAKQGSEWCIWALIDTNEHIVHRVINVYGTGQPLPEDPGIFIDTVMDGAFVWHFFDDGEIYPGSL